MEHKDLLNSMPFPAIDGGTAPGWEGVCPQSHRVAGAELEPGTLEVKVEATVFTVSVVISFCFSQQTHSCSEKKGNMVSSGHTVRGAGEPGLSPGSPDASAHTLSREPFGI